MVPRYGGADAAASALRGIARLLLTSLVVICKQSSRQPGNRWAFDKGVEVVDPKESAQVLVALSRDSRDAVDAIVSAGLAADGTEPKDAQDYGFMYSRDLEDPDGNVLEFMYMSEEAAEQGPEAYMAEQGGASA